MTSSSSHPKHLTTGDAFPNLPTDNADKLILLSMLFCPYAQRAHLVLEAKRIPHHVVNINLTHKPEWLTDYSRLGKVPALGLTNEPGKPFIYESLIVADYLDEKYDDAAAGGRQLHPTDALRKAQDRLWVDQFDGVIKAYYRLGFAAVAAAAPDAKPTADSTALWDDLFAGLAQFDAELRRRGTRFFVGDRAPGMLDYMIWPWLERLDALPLLPNYAGVQQFDVAGRLPTLAQYKADMEQDETVKKRFLSADIHLKYILGRLTGAPNYELLSSL